MDKVSLAWMGDKLSSGLIRSAQDSPFVLTGSSLLASHALTWAPLTAICLPSPGSQLCLFFLGSHCSLSFLA
jgi:hypothetical protein